MTLIIVPDPTADAVVKLDLEDLDFLNEQIVTMRQDRLVGADRPLTFDETDALDYNGTLLAEIDEPWLLDHGVSVRLDYFSQILDEAIYQRDLPRAQAKKAAGQDLNALERAAWERHIREKCYG